MRWAFATLTFLASCVPEGKPPLHDGKAIIGAACASDGDCSSGTCMSTNFLGYLDWDAPEGYCTRSCTSDADCDGARCAEGFGGQHYCGTACSDGSSCRPNYACFRSDRICEPDTFLTCDASVAACTTVNGNPGGCLRAALGSGAKTGSCQSRCTVGNSVCIDEFACIWVDQDPDPFHGTVCLRVPSNPTPLGAPCTYVDECVKGAECAGTGADRICRRLCNPKVNLNCPSGQTCEDFFGELANATFAVGACR